MRLYTIILVIAVIAVPLAQGATSFDRYRIILDRKPFGEAPPPEPVPQQPINPRDSFAASLRMSALLEVEGGGIRIGLIDLQSKQDFFLGVGDIENGIELISASYDDEEAVLRKGDEMAVIKLNGSGDVQPLTADQQQQRLERRSSRPSYAERRRMREERRRAKPPVEPKYTGEELERHLQDYQMEVIRQGLPPLPIPLTEEMDNQLVEEGVLPPMQ